MKSQCVLGAVTVAFLCAMAQPATAGPEDEVAKCTSTITSNRSTTVVISGHKFRCPGQIIVAEENEAQILSNSSDANAYYKGALIHGQDKVRYFVVVENWADPQRCSVLVGPMTINGGNLMQVGQGRLSGSWEDVAQLLVTKSAYKWADSFQASTCKRGVWTPPPGSSPRTISVSKEGAGRTTVFTVTGTGFTPNRLVVIRITASNFQQLQFAESAGADGNFVSRHSAPCASGLQLTFTAFEDASPANTNATPVITTCP
jgi:hypothetical protein